MQSSRPLTVNSGNGRTISWSAKYMTFIFIKKWMCQLGWMIFDHQVMEERDGYQKPVKHQQPFFSSWQKREWGYLLLVKGNFLLHLPFSFQNHYIYPLLWSSFMAFFCWERNQPKLYVFFYYFKICCKMHPKVTVVKWFDNFFCMIVLDKAFPCLWLRYKGHVFLATKASISSGI